MVDEILIAGLVSCVFGMLGALIGGYIMWSWLGPRIVTDSVTPLVGPALYNWLTAPSMSTGKKKKMVDPETGEEMEMPEAISPLQNIMNEAGKVTYFMLMSKLGVDARKKQVAIGDIQNAIMEGSPLAGALSAISPKLMERAVKDGDYIPIVLQLFGPKIEEMFMSKGKYIGATVTNNGGWANG